MTVASEDTPTPSPWLSVWFRPGNTIERVLVTGRRRDLVLLAALAAASSIASGFIDRGLTTTLLDWRFLLGAVVVATAAGIVNLYVSAVLLSWVGRIFRGRASPAQMRAVIAWGMAPLGVALVIYLAVIAGLKLFTSGNTIDSASADVVPGLGVVAAFTSFWTFGMLMIMLKRVQTFGWWRAIFTLSIGLFFAPLLVLFVTLPFNAFLLQPFDIPAGSMAPTLLIGDYFFVSKFSYGYSRYSLPFGLPLISGRILAHSPERGDDIVFKWPKDNSTDYIKRLIGLPGDKVQMKSGLLYINGQPVKRERIEDYLDPEDHRLVAQFIETLPNGMRHRIIEKQGDNGPYDNTNEFDVPAGSYFMMGDNRDNSADSRAWGFVPAENLVGRAEFIFFSINRNSGKKQPAIRYERIGMAIR